jgi:hypothetical protein
MVSASSSLTNVPADESVAHNVDAQDLPGHGSSAIPEDKKAELLENLEDDWQDDLENPRNWSSSKKWTSAAVVCAILFTTR